MAASLNNGCVAATLLEVPKELLLIFDRKKKNAISTSGF